MKKHKNQDEEFNKWHDNDAVLLENAKKELL